MAINLNSIKRNTPKLPRVIIHGEPGVGKTTFAACAPSPIIIQTEDGLGNLDVPAFPLAQSFEQVMESLATLYSEKHGFRTLVVDSLDWLEPLIWTHTCAKNDKPSVESFGYGKGYVEALTYWRQFLDAVTALRDERGMLIVMTAHSEMRRVEDPLLPAFDCHDLKLHKRAGALCEEFADVILFAAVQTNTVTEDAGFNNKRIRAVTTGNRVMHTVGQPAFLAKNRYSLPSPLPLAWESFAQAMGFAPATPAQEAA